MGIGGRDRDDLRYRAVVAFAENCFACFSFPWAPFSELDSPKCGSARFGALYVDHMVPVEEIREELRRIVENDAKWRGQMCAPSHRRHGVRHLIVCSIDARNASAAWDLRYEVRERLIQFLQEKNPRGLP